MLSTDGGAVGPDTRAPPGRMSAVRDGSTAVPSGHPPGRMARIPDAMGRAPGRTPTRNRTVRRGLAAVIATAVVLLLPTLVAAHPLGNFTINHYAGLRVEADRVVIDLVIDEAEIPAYQARAELDLDGDGTISATETDAGRQTECAALVPSIQLQAGGTSLAPIIQAAGLAFPPGAGGLSTMRLACVLTAPLPLAVSAGSPTRLTLADSSFAERIGWREIVATGSGVTLTAVTGTLRSASLSDRLAAYPADRIASPLDDRSLAVDVTLGGPTLPPLVVAEAAPLAATADPAPAPAASSAAVAPAPAASSAVSAPAGAVPGGVSGPELPSIFRTADLTPLVVLLSVLTAAALGAGHALTPGHGKTLMAAYLVGTRGTPAHALGLGLSVSLSHTVGILVLAAVIIGAADVLPPDLVVRGAPVVAAASIVAIGGWMLLNEWRRRRTARSASPGAAAGHVHHGSDAQRTVQAGDGVRSPGPRFQRGPRRAAPAADPLVHTHGGVTHSHLPPAGSSITWRSLFVLGLAGGLIPSTSALLILLGSIAAGRPAFGFLLVLAFGLGMAGVMAGIGLAMVLARGRLDRVPAGAAFGRLRGAVPLVAAVLVFGFGIYLTVQAVGGTPTL
jgi:ABC-type nickel/cobalt efflux system permease component RcnA